MPIPGDRPRMPMTAGYALADILHEASTLRAIHRSELESGDILVVRTTNSVYTLRAVAHGTYHATGGWFDRKGLSPFPIAINGCTWGGKIIKVDVLAACGLCVEFSNRVVTSPVRTIAVLRAATFN